MLNDYNLPYFHSTDFNCGTGVAKDLTIEQRVSCVKRLIKIISDVKLEYISYILAHDTFGEVLREFDLPNLSIYDFLLATTISDVCVRMEFYKSQTDEPTEGVLVIEEGCPLDATLSQELQKAAARQKLGALVNISCFGKDQIPCQVADIIAYDSYKIMQNSEVDKIEQVIRVGRRKSFEKIVEGNPFHAFVIKADGLRNDFPQIKEFLERIRRY